jgi:hypothetical protein
MKIRILPTMNAQTFLIECLPGTLVITQGRYGTGYEIDIQDLLGHSRLWYAHEILDLRFKEAEENVPAQNDEEVGELSGVSQPA